MLNEMLSGEELIKAMENCPPYDESCRNKSRSERLVQLNDLYKVFLPSAMSTEIYSKLYLATMRSLRKKKQREVAAQQTNNFRRVKGQPYDGAGIIGGSDSFTIIGTPGIGKSTSIVRAMQLISNGAFDMDDERRFTVVIPYIICQCPFDCSVKSLLLDILRQVDMAIGSNYCEKAVKAHATTDMLIGSVSQVAIHHVGLLVVDEIQNVVNHKYGKQLVGMLTQLINNSGISICMVGTPECEEFFESTAYLARRTMGLKYGGCEYNDYFRQFCNTLFSYQYVKKPAEISEGIRLWLYEHSKGVISVVVTLLHDAQEKAILEGVETLDQEILEKTYEERLRMLHIYLYEKKEKRPEPVKKELVTENDKVTAGKAQEIGKETGKAQEKSRTRKDARREKERDLILQTAMTAKRKQEDIAEALKEVISVLEVEL